MIEHVALALGVVAAIALAALVARRTGLPSPALLALGGLAYAYLPGPNLELDPEVVLVLIIPPLLYSAALNASLLDIKANRATIGSLSVGLVLATSLIVGLVAWLTVPGLPFAAGCALGALVAPPDAVAAIAIGRRLGLPRRLLTVIEGEGLINDATALTTYRVAVAAVGGSFSLLTAGRDFLVSAGGGAAVGVAVALLIGLIRKRLEETLVENALSLATPFLAFIPAEELHVSGVLAVVVCGLILGHKSPILLSGSSRLQTRAVWRLIDFLLEGLVFLLIGSQLPHVLSGLQAYPTSTVVTASVAIVLAVVLVRPAWVFLSGGITGLVAPRATTLPWRQQAILSWAGSRGVISLAAAFALPLEAGAAPFPARDLLLFLTFVVVLVTLVGQGLTLAPLLRRLGVLPDRRKEILEQANARHAVVAAGLRRLDELVAVEEPPAGIVKRLRVAAEDRRNAGWEQLGSAENETPSLALARLRREMIAVERDELLRWRSAGRLGDTGLRVLEGELDIEEALLAVPPGTVNGH
jgi:CPA1 family monovalent cation:H+ antiporter